MLPEPTTAGLMRSLGLDVDGPARWGSLLPSQAPGVFVVETDAPLAEAPIDLTAIRRWLERVPDLRLDGERPTPNALAQRLAAFWIAGQSLLYVGRTSKSLAGRVAALYATELGHRRPHAGGHWLKTLRDPARLRLWWAVTDASEEYEDALLGAFAESLPAGSRMRLAGSDIVLPWANVGSPVGPARDTGLSASLLSLEATPDTPSNVRRSDPLLVDPPSPALHGLHGTPGSAAVGSDHHVRREPQVGRPASSPRTSRRTDWPPCGPSWGSYGTSSVRRSWSASSMRASWATCARTPTTKRHATSSRSSRAASRSSSDG